MDIEISFRDKPTPLGREIRNIRVYDKLYEATIANQVTLIFLLNVLVENLVTQLPIGVLGKITVKSADGTHRCETRRTVSNGEFADGTCYTRSTGFVSSPTPSI